MLQSFANLKKLELKVLASFEQCELILRLILPRLEHIKSLIFISNARYPTSYEAKSLRDISDLTQLEELKMWSIDLSGENVNFEADSVNKLIENCQNLRVVELGKHSSIQILYNYKLIM